MPGFGVGGRGFPLTAVRSAPAPPLGPICWYCPERGAGLPGFNVFIVLVLLRAEAQYVVPLHMRKLIMYDILEKASDHRSWFVLDRRITD